MGAELTDKILDKKIVQRVAKLSSLAVKEEELTIYATDLGGIINWMEQLNEVDVSNVQPMVGTEIAQLRLREDVVTDGDCKEDVLSNAPERIADFYAVPKVVE
ncbi:MULTISPECIES: Asp-tRNA(Asn)/Glu-tRNA(Gln) amidotransferase subunit GatC [Commensalibacter]|uniref:Aspartyl/glutamyl-tRNA(Asn/Gln) amidotransferase subunit C n=2 Tax=Commensalibacter TaxID=1079922 RepID=W7E821_9PROT|nr:MULTISPECIES: Asp-tRNA(Asn)/Glu-tRNA(Gln) amidotransferase subunit GatC [Commensalibacter]EUK19291.1 glutamyl-tRNA(Gln) amidotransferase subunit C [Commensalibacter papalotli (ex Servin-Garciduenas et al. 2014)]CAI3932809.1 Asp-tRNAAsn/Glu-tRNAGln amidotransferase C subunit (GatC) (PDB:3H0L) [Commensalibacter papalotli (ex Botero et al. 2024)]CAI3948819.1 Asp-tRNAAsn/Glu-tRNAGln amidotransferase C subunit (GatC) (PDB:3H0L) [Commensalibacter papalotli (ex Botero et al. 2024)]